MKPQREVVLRGMVLHPDVAADLLLVEKMLPERPRDGVLRCVLCDWAEKVQWVKNGETGLVVPDYRPVYRHTKEAHAAQVRQWEREIAKRLWEAKA